MAEATDRKDSFADATEGVCSFGAYGNSRASNPAGTAVRVAVISTRERAMTEGRGAGEGFAWPPAPDGAPSSPSVPLTDAHDKRPGLG